MDGPPPARPFRIRGICGSYDAGLDSTVVAANSFQT